MVVRNIFFVIGSLRKSAWRVKENIDREAQTSRVGNFTHAEKVFRHVYYCLTVTCFCTYNPNLKSHSPGCIPLSSM